MPKRLLLLAFALFLCSAFHEPYLIKRISDANFRYEFYTTLKEAHTKIGKTYYWFKGGAIHNAQGGMAGELLDGGYKKFYLNNQLAEEGAFKKGLKAGLWKTWYENGVAETTQYWDNGLQTGLYYLHSKEGVLTEKGNFRKGKKHGLWINYVSKDSVRYKKGAVYIAKRKLTKEEKIKAKEERKRLKEDEKRAAAAQKQQRQAEKQKKDAAKGQKLPGETRPDDGPKKPGFFQRLFGKKTKP